MLTVSEALKSLTWMTKLPLNSVGTGFFSVSAQQEGQFGFREIDWRFEDKKKPCWKWELVIYIDNDMHSREIPTREMKWENENQMS